MLFNKTYSLRKSRHILENAYTWYKKKGDQLDPAVHARLEKEIEALDNAILSKDRTKADQLARDLEQFCKANFKKSLFTYTTELIFALVFALCIATIVRQMWFEPYEIPTGSMRPTFKEQDHLTVSKLAFGINTPLETKHLYFDPNLTQRTSVLIFSGDKIPFIDQETTFFWILPYKKRYIKRTIGKPGDMLYFYGGKIYGIDQEGNPIKELLDSPWMANLEHIPFLNFEGYPTVHSMDNIVLHQMYLPIGMISIYPNGITAGKIFNGKEWIKDKPGVQNKPHDSIESYSDFWGMRNFAMARLLTKQQLQKNGVNESKEIEDSESGLYLELRHTPSLSYPAPLFHAYGKTFGILLNPYVTFIPLTKAHLDAIMDQMYTARFVVKDQKAKRYSLEGSTPKGEPSFPNVPNGTYEFYFGKAVQIGWGGTTWALAKDHPLYDHSAENIQKLYNLGIDMDTAYNPAGKNQALFPTRYAYFRSGDLYLLGAPIIKKDDSALINFIEREKQREAAAPTNKPYVAFLDHGPPLKADGTLDANFIKTFGIRVPDKHYLVLGDNHAMSSDSRVFGFVPEDNLQGAPSLIIWPPGSRWGFPQQKPYPIFNIPRLIIWSIAALVAVILYLLHRRKMQRSIFKSSNRFKELLRL